MPAWAAVVDAEIRCGMRAEALEDAAEALTRLNDPPGELFETLFGKDAADGEVWFRVLRARHEKERVPWVMQRVDALLGGKWTRQEVLALLWEDILLNKLEVKGADELAIFRATVKVLERAELANELQVARQRLEKADRDGRELLSLGLAEIKAKQWAAAEKLCERALAKDAGRAAPRYLRGHALVQLGHEKEGREMMQLARLIPLGDDAERYALAEVMSKAGLADEARAEHEFLTRIGEFSGWEVGNAMRIVAERARESGDELRAADLWERSTLPCLKGSTGFTEVGAYLWVPHLIHKTRAAGLINAGKIDEGLKEMRLCEEYLPGDVSVLIEMASKLRKAARERELEEMADRAMQRQQALLADYPKAARLHNSLAWMLARCRVNLDIALLHAHRAVELEPKSAAIWDTLGEVYFQKGQKQKAIEAMKICLEIEPDVERHWLQMKRIDTGAVESDPPQ
jgi:tetratricopeptide (TPR) repeat protein